MNETVELSRAEGQSRTARPATLAAMPAGVVVILLGLFFVFGVGFAQPQLLHDAAHDARHAFALPCH